MPSTYDVCFLVNVPRDMFSQDLTDLKNFIKSFIAQNFLIGRSETRVAVITFDDDATVTFYLNNFYTQERVDSAIDSIVRRGSRLTNITAALEQARTQVFIPSRGERPEAPNLVYLMVWRTSSSMSIERILREGVQLRTERIPVFGVGFGRDIDIQQLNAASWSPQFVIRTTSINVLSSTELWQSSSLLFRGES